MLRKRSCEIASFLPRERPPTHFHPRYPRAPVVLPVLKHLTHPSPNSSPTQNRNCQNTLEPHCRTRSRLPTQTRLHQKPRPKRYTPYRQKCPDRPRIPSHAARRSRGRGHGRGLEKVWTPTLTRDSRLGSRLFPLVSYFVESRSRSPSFYSLALGSRPLGRTSGFCARPHGTFL